MKRKRGRTFRAVVLAGGTLAVQACASSRPASPPEGPVSTPARTDSDRAHQADRADRADPANRARALFESHPRTRESIDEAYRTMSLAAASENIDESERFRRLIDASRYGTWLVRRDFAGIDVARESRDFAEAAIVLFPKRVEGHYFRATSLGLIVKNNPMFSGASLGSMVESARRALELDETYSEAGPHRTLGAVLMRAPGRPWGIGDKAAARAHLERAVELFPDQPDNLIFLAESLAEGPDPDPERARTTLEYVETLVPSVPDPIDRQRLIDGIEYVRKKL